MRRTRWAFFRAMNDRQAFSRFLNDADADARTGSARVEPTDAALEQSYAAPPRSREDPGPELRD